MRQADELPERRADPATGSEEAELSVVPDGNAEAATSQERQEPFTAAEPFGTPQGGQAGWAFVMPERFLPVYPGAEDQAVEDEAGEEAPPRKRARMAGGADDATPPPAGGSAPRPTAPGDVPASSTDAADPKLALAAELADRTAVISYAYTAAYALEAVTATLDEASRPALPRRPLKVVVLGAAGDAELADLASWQVVAAALDRDVRIDFVGPEVPDHLAASSTQRGRVAMSFLQCTYDQGLAGGNGSVEAGAGAGSSAAGPTRTTPAPDVYLAFNPGFTCPDYEWSDTLAALGRPPRQDNTDAGGGGGGGGSSTAARRPLLVVATNTRVEAQMDGEVLREHGWVALAPEKRNPYSSLKTAQSGTLANDLYRKNAWLVIYEHVAAHRSRKDGKRRRGGPRKGKGAARALYDTVIAPVVRLISRR